MGALSWLPSAGRPGAGRGPHFLERDAILPVLTPHRHDISSPGFPHWCPWGLFKKPIHHLPAFLLLTVHASPVPCCISPGKLTAPSNFLLLCPGLLSVFDNLASITGSLEGAYPSLRAPLARRCFAALGCLVSVWPAGFIIFSSKSSPVTPLLLP